MTALPAFLLASTCSFPGDDRHIPTVMLDWMLDEQGTRGDTKMKGATSTRARGAIKPL